MASLTVAQLTPDVAHQQHAVIIGLRRGIEAQFLALGLALTAFRDGDGWRALGHSSFAAYLSSPEVALSYSHAQCLVQVAEAFGPMLLDSDRSEQAAQLARIGVAKARLLAPLVTEAPPAELDGWLDQAETLGVRDLRRALQHARGEVPANLDTEEYHELAHQLSALALRLNDAATRGEALARLDDLQAATLKARARLEASAEVAA